MNVLHVLPSDPLWHVAVTHPDARVDDDGTVTIEEAQP